jgi:hypothetical protein
MSARAAHLSSNVVFGEHSGAVFSLRDGRSTAAVDKRSAPLSLSTNQQVGDRSPMAFRPRVGGPLSPQTRVPALHQPRAQPGPYSDFAAGPSVNRAGVIVK